MGKLAVAVGILFLLLLLGWLAFASDRRAPVDMTSPRESPSHPYERDVPRVDASLVQIDALPVDADDPTPDSRRVAGTVLGRCLEQGTQRGLAQVIVRATTGDGELTRTRTADDGTFALAYEGPPGAWLEALPPRGFVKARGPALRPEHLNGSEELVLQLPRGTSLPILGTVVDPATDEGVFQVEVWIEMPEAELEETVTTDLAGAFATTIAFPSGTVSAHVSDLDVPLTTAHRTWLDEGRIGDPWRIEAKIGPTIRLGPDDVTGFRARLEETPRTPPYAAELEVHSATFRLLDSSAVVKTETEVLRTRLGYLGSDDERSAAAGPVDERIWPWLVVRAGPQAWIRYPQPIHAPDPALRAKVVVSDGSLRGEAEVEGTVGIQPAVAIRLAAVGSLSGRVIDTTGTPLTGARLVLEYREEPGEREVRVTETTSGGVFAFLDVPTGQVELRIEPKVHAGERLEWHVSQGQHRIDDIVLPATSLAGPVAGSLVAPRGVPMGVPILLLESDEGSRFRDVSAGFGGRTPEGGLQFSFGFPDVPTGSYSLSVIHTLPESGVTNGVWEPSERTVYPPRGDLVFEARSLGELERLVFVVTSTTPTEPTSDYELVLGPHGGWLGSFLRDGPAVLHLPAEAHFEWTVAKRGFRPVHGDENDVRIQDGTPSVNVHLAPGWGGTLYVREAPPFQQRESFESLNTHFYSARPLAGLAVRLDGAYCGRTDLDGRLLLEAARVPNRIQVLAPGYEAAAVSSYHTEGDGHLAFGILWLHRREQERAK